MSPSSPGPVLRPLSSARPASVWTPADAMMLCAPIALLGLALSSTPPLVRALLGPLAAAFALGSLAVAPLRAAAGAVVAERVRAGDAAVVGPAAALAISLSALAGLGVGIAVGHRAGLLPGSALLMGGAAALFSGSVTAAAAVSAGGYPRPVLLAAWAGPALGAGLLLPATRGLGTAGALLAAQAGLVLSFGALAGDLLARSRHAVVAGAPAALRQIADRPVEALAAAACPLAWWALLLRPTGAPLTSTPGADLLAPALAGALSALLLHLTEESSVRAGYVRAFLRAEADGTLSELRDDLLEAERGARRAAMRGIAFAAAIALAVLALGGAIGHPLGTVVPSAIVAAAAALLAAAAPLAQALSHLRRPLVVAAASAPLPAAWVLAALHPLAGSAPLVWLGAAAMQLGALLVALRAARHHAPADLVAGDLELQDLLPSPAPKPPPLA